MRSLRLAVGVLLPLGTVIATEAACDDEDEVSYLEKTQTDVSATPQVCVDSGNEVVLSVKMTGPPDECRAADAAIEFVNASGQVVAKVSATQASTDAVTYTLTAQVPLLLPGTYGLYAFGCKDRHGTLAFSTGTTPRDPRFQTHATLTIPCPQDAGNEAGSDGGPVDGPPLAGSVAVRLNQVNASTVVINGDTEIRRGPAMQAKEVSDVLDREGPIVEAVAKGTCVDDPRRKAGGLPTFPDVKGFDLGPTIDLKTGGTIAGTYNRTAGGADSFFYVLQFPSMLLAGTSYDVELGGSAVAPKTMLASTMSVPTNLDITSPEYTTVGPLPPAGFTLTWALPAPEALVVVSPSHPSNVTKLCRIDTSTGSFAVPQAVLDSGKGAPGGQVDLEVTAYRHTTAKVMVDGAERNVALMSKNTKHVRFQE